MFRIWLAYADEHEVKEDPTLRGEKLKFKRDKISKKLDQYLSDSCSAPRALATLRGRPLQKSRLQRTAQTETSQAPSVTATKECTICG